MKKIAVVIFCIIVNPAWGQSFPYYVSSGDLMRIERTLNADTPLKLREGFFTLTKAELRLLRNTIYAKYGYYFNSKDLQDHFAQFRWYSGRKSNVDGDMTETDKENIRLIQMIEANYPESSDETLIGNWVSNYYERRDDIINGRSIVVDLLPSFRVYPSGTFYMSAYDGYGLWKIEDDALELKYLYTRSGNLPRHGSSEYYITDILEYHNVQLSPDKFYLGCKFFDEYNDLWIKISDTPDYLVK
jgi:hypothetical protein